MPVQQQVTREGARDPAGAYYSPARFVVHGLFGRLLAGLVGERVAHRELDILLEQETRRGQLPGGRTKFRLAGCGWCG